MYCFIGKWKRPDQEIPVNMKGTGTHTAHVKSALHGCRGKPVKLSKGKWWRNLNREKKLKWLLSSVILGDGYILRYIPWDNSNESKRQNAIWDKTATFIVTHLLTYKNTLPSRNMGRLLTSHAHGWIEPNFVALKPIFHWENMSQRIAWAFIMINIWYFNVTFHPEMSHAHGNR